MLNPVFSIGYTPFCDSLNPVLFSVGHEVFCVRYSPDGQFIAASRGDGNIDVYSTGTGVHRTLLSEI